MRSILPPHFVTSDFDVAPINGQDLTRFSHSASPEEYVVIGSEISAMDYLEVIGKKTLVPVIAKSPVSRSEIGQ